MSPRIKKEIHYNADAIKLIEDHLDLVPLIVKSYMKHGYCGINYNLLKEEELTAICYLALVECAHQYDSEKAAFNTYLTYQAKYSFIKAEKKEFQHRQKLISIEEEQRKIENDENKNKFEKMMKSPAPTPLETVENRDSRRYLIEKLTPFFTDGVDVGTVIALMEDGMSQRKIAAKLGVTPHTINGAVKKIRKQVQDKPDFFKNTCLEQG